MGRKFGDIFAVLTIAGLAILFTCGARCQNDDPVLQTVRVVHTDVRSAFVQMDGFLAPMLETAGAECEAIVDAQGLTGHEGYAAWQVCTRNWMTIELSISASRELFAQLEDVYEDIEAGIEHNTDVMFILRQIASHARSILRVIDVIGVGNDNETARNVIAGFRQGSEQLCEMITCDPE